MSFLVPEGVSARGEKEEKNDSHFSPHPSVFSKTVLIFNPSCHTEGAAFVFHREGFFFASTVAACLSLTILGFGEHGVIYPFEKKEGPSEPCRKSECAVCIVFFRREGAAAGG